MLECKPVTTPLETNLIVSSCEMGKNNELLSNITEVQKLIG